MRDGFPANPTIAVIGAGAIGCYYGGRLARAGLPVHFLFRSDYQHVRQAGLKVHSAQGDFAIAPAELHAYASAGEMPKADLVLVTLKSTDNSAAEGLIRPILREKTAILTLQNGLGNEELLARFFGADRVLGGICFICANRISAGVIYHSDHGRIDFGEFVPPAASPRARLISELFGRAGIETRVVDDLALARWMKLSWNIPFNGLSALFDVTTDKLLATGDGLRLIAGMIEEVSAIAAAEGISLPVNLAQRQIDATRSMGAYVTSTLLDRRRGRPMEIDAIFAHPLAVARSRDVRAPLLEFLNYGLSRINASLRRDG